MNKKIEEIKEEKIEEIKEEKIEKVKEKKIEEIKEEKIEKVKEKKIEDTKTYLKIKNGKILPAEKKEIENNDYILEYNNILIVDKDKNTIRPYVEDLLGKMDIETKHAKYIKNVLLITGVSMFLLFFSFMIIWGNKNTLRQIDQKIINIDTKINELKTQTTSNFNTNL